MIRILNLMDNSSSGHKALRTEHGLSLHIRTQNFSFVFDFGQSDATMRNAEALGVDPAKVSCAICSHSHYDHVGGYLKFADAQMRCPLVVGRDFFDEKYSALGGAFKYTGVNFEETDLAKRSVGLRECSDIEELGDGVFAVSGFSPKNEFETLNPSFVRLARGNFSTDDFREETCIVIDAPDGLCAIVGCSHVGIVNILESISKRFGKRVSILIGGTHLAEASEERIAKTAAYFVESGIRTAALNHCSGEKINAAIAADARITGIPLGAGACVFL